MSIVGWGCFLSFYLAGCWIILRGRLSRRRPTLLDELRRVDMPWCFLRFGENEESPEASSLSSQSFLELIQTERVTWKTLTSLLGPTLDSPFQTGVRVLLRGEKRHITFEINLYGEERRVDLWCVSPFGGREKSLAQSLLLTIQPATQKQHLREKVDTLSKDQSFLFHMINSLPIPIWTRDREGRLTFCNAAYAKLLETQPHQVLSRQWELIDGEDSKEAHHLFERVLKEGGTCSLCVKRRHKGTNQEIVITEAAFPAALRQQESAQEPQLVGMALTISLCCPDWEQRQRQFEGTLALVQSLNKPFCVFSSDARVVTFTESFAQLLSLDPSWLIKGATALEILEFLREQDQLPEYVAFSVIKARCQKWFAEPSKAFRAIWPFPSGKVFEIAAMKEPSGLVLVSLEEVTQILSLEGQLKSLTSVWDFMVAHAFESLFIVGLDHRVQKASQKASLLLEIPHEDLIGKTAKEILTILSQKYGVPGGCAVLEDALELRNPHKINLSTNKGQLIGEYAPLPDGCHLLRFIPLENPDAAHTDPQWLSLFESGETEEERRVSAGG